VTADQKQVELERSHELFQVLGVGTDALVNVSASNSVKLEF
jgi:hypothetical protein